jgi:hypothetical protein
MIRLTRQALVVAAAISVLAGGAAAQQGMGNGGGKGPPDNTPFQAIDTDGNGTLSKTEVTAWAEGVFGAMDSDANGKLTLEEYMAVRMGPGASGTGTGPRAAEMQAAKAERFKTMDTNHDNAVSHDEFMANAGARFAAAGGKANKGVNRQRWMKVQ